MASSARRASSAPISVSPSELRHQRFAISAA
jgi:hypothetical protein